MRHLLLALGMVILVTGCVSATHRRYVWSPTAPACPASFTEDTRACFDVGYVPNLFGGGQAIWKVTYEDCMKHRGYQQVGGTMEPDKRRNPSLWPWETGKWPWPEYPPASSWAALRITGGVRYLDAVCVPPESVGTKPTD